MDDVSRLVEFAEEIFNQKTGYYLSELQRLILASSLQGDRKTYDQIADECGYSPKYVRQDVAPKLWQLFTDVLEEKVSKTNIKPILQRKIRDLSNPKPVTPSQRLPVRSVASRPQLFNHLKANILLVDDQPQNLNLLSELLEEQGYEIREAINGALALQTVAMKAPDLILLDINMPDLDGYTVCQQLKSNPDTQNIPVIFISALDEAWDKVRGFSVGAVDYIAKPFKAMEVLARVENHLKTGQLQQELTEKTLELQQALRELSELKKRDPVTQLGNGLDLEDALISQWETAIQDQQTLTLILVQLNEFEDYCDRYSIADGDHCLYQIAQKLTQVFSEWKDQIFTDQKGRFIIVISEVTSDDLQKRQDLLLKEISSLPLCTSITLNFQHQTITPSGDITVQNWLTDCLNQEN